MGQRCIVLVLAYMLIVLQSAAISIHRSFRTREVGFGGGVSASVPVDSKVSAYAAAEAAAKEQKLGLWQGANPISPYEWRKAKRRM